jgi:hypothetical protein
MPGQTVVRPAGRSIGWRPVASEDELLPTGRPPLAGTVHVLLEVRLDLAKPSVEAPFHLRDLLVKTFERSPPETVLAPEVRTVPFVDVEPFVGNVLLASGTGRHAGS